MKRAANYFREFISDSHAASIFIAGLAFNVMIWFLIIWRLPVSASWVPLHYSYFFGIDKIGPWISAIYYPLSALFIIVINCALFIFLPGLNRRFAYILLWGALAVQALVLGAMAALIINYFG